MLRLTRKKAQEIAKAVNKRSGVLPLGFFFAVAEEGDIEAVLRIGAECFDYNPPTRREIGHLIRKGHGACFLVLDAVKTPVAYITFEAHAGRQSVYANTTAVIAAQRGKGLGQATYVLKDAIASGIGARSFFAHVKEDNDPVLHLIQKNGFRKIRTEEQYYDDGTSAHVFKKEYPAT